MTVHLLGEQVRMPNDAFLIDGDSDGDRCSFSVLMARLKLPDRFGGDKVFLAAGTIQPKARFRGEEWGVSTVASTFGTSIGPCGTGGLSSLAGPKATSRWGDGTSTSLNRSWSRSASTESRHRHVPSYAHLSPSLRLRYLFRRRGRGRRRRRHSLKWSHSLGAGDTGVSSAGCGVFTTVGIATASVPWTRSDSVNGPTCIRNSHPGLWACTRETLREPAPE